MSPTQETRHHFQAQGPSRHLERMRRNKESKEDYGVNLQPVFVGIAAREENDHIEIGFASHDGTYSIDFAVQRIEKESCQDVCETVTDHIIAQMKEYELDHMYKFVGGGIGHRLVQLCPDIPARLWAELDLVPLVFEMGLELGGASLGLDEEADSMVRKCLMFFGPSQQPRVEIGFRNAVEVDSNRHGQLTTLEQYQNSVSKSTWDATMKYADSIMKRGVKIAFFSSTPQGGGVALMRHALIRFFRIIGVDCRWYVPRPKPEVFRITKTNHNILQGVADAKERLSDTQKKTMKEWVQQNAERFWTSPGGPLASDSTASDVVIVDDPQMPNLVQIAKEADPNRPVIFRSHIQVRSDLADQGNNPTAEVWQWLWEYVKDADVFISHPVREFVPKNIPNEKVGYLPATTDWLDGLNKELSDWDTRYYIHNFNLECQKLNMTQLAFPKRDYIVQIARFDPSKGIPDVLEAYAQFRRKHTGNWETKSTPQLVIAGHGAVDDPDGSSILDKTLEACEGTYSDLRDDIIVMRLGPTDQVLNALLSNAKVALQLSTREGFEVKVSEALHKGIPIIATKAGGIPLQVEDGKSGFLVEPNDPAAVAEKLSLLFKDEKRYKEMSTYAAQHVSDEVSTVGNALSWLFLADKLSRNEKVEPNGRWINDMAREAAGVPYKENEARLPRNEHLKLK